MPPPFVSSPANVLPVPGPNNVMLYFQQAPPAYNLLVNLPFACRRFTGVQEDGAFGLLLMHFTPLPPTPGFGNAVNSALPGIYTAFTLINNPRFNTIRFCFPVSQFYLSWSIGGAPNGFQICCSDIDRQRRTT